MAYQHRTFDDLPIEVFPEPIFDTAILEVNFYVDTYFGSPFIGVCGNPFVNGNWDCTVTVDSVFASGCNREMVNDLSADQLKWLEQHF